MKNLEQTHKLKTMRHQKPGHPN